MTQIQSAPELHCPDCGYSLQLIESSRCPECGLAIDRSSLGQSVIPWVHRRRIGWYRAFWKTVFLATFKTQKLALDMNVPAHLRDALWFRRLVVLHALLITALPLTGMAILIVTRQSWSSLWTNSDLGGSVFQVLSLVVGWVCMAGFFMTGSGVTGYFFSPDDLTPIRQNRAVILSLYTSAPLAWLPLTLFLAVGLTYLMASYTHRNIEVSQILLGCGFIAAYGPLLIQFIAMVRSPVVLLGALTHNTGRQWALGLTLPFAWPMLGFILLLVVPLGWSYLGALLLSFRH